VRKIKSIIGILLAFLLSVEFSGMVNVYAEESVKIMDTQTVTNTVNDNQLYDAGTVNEAGENSSDELIPEEPKEEEAIITTGQAVDFVVEEEGISVVEEVYKSAQYIINVEAIDTEGNLINSYQLLKEGIGVYEVQAKVIDGYKALSETLIVELTEDNRTAAIVMVYEKIIPKVKFRERVFDMANNKGIEGVLVTFINKESNEETVCLTDSGGFFEAELVAGNYSLKLTKRGFKDKIIDLEIK